MIGDGHLGTEGNRWNREFSVSSVAFCSKRRFRVMPETTRHKSRRLVHPATHDSYAGAGGPLHAPLFPGHRGDWRALVDLHPAAPYCKTPVRLSRPVESPLGVC